METSLKLVMTFKSAGDNTVDLKEAVKAKVIQTETTEFDLKA